MKAIQGSGFMEGKKERMGGLDELIEVLKDVPVKYHAGAMQIYQLAYHEMARHHAHRVSDEVYAELQKQRQAYRLERVKHYVKTMQEETGRIVRPEQQTTQRMQAVTNS